MRYAAHAIKRIDYTHASALYKPWVPAILSGPDCCTRPPNRLHQRLSHKAYPTRAEAVAAAQRWIDRHLLQAP